MDRLKTVGWKFMSFFWPLPRLITSISKYDRVLLDGEETDAAKTLELRYAYPGNHKEILQGVTVFPGR